MICRRFELELGADFVLWNFLSQALNVAKHALNGDGAIEIRDSVAPDSI
jgi:hypothetical protein